MFHWLKNFRLLSSFGCCSSPKYKRDSLRGSCFNIAQLVHLTSDSLVKNREDDETLVHSVEKVEGILFHRFCHLPEYVLHVGNTHADIAKS